MDGSPTSGLFRRWGCLSRTPQIFCHLIDTIVVFLVMNLFTRIWNPVAVALIANEDLRNTVSSIVTTVVTGGVSMVIIFLVDKKIFAPGFSVRRTSNAHARGRFAKKFYVSR